MHAGIEYRQQSIEKHLLFHVNKIHKKVDIIK